MATKTLRFTGVTVDYTIRSALKKIGLPQERTFIRVLQKEQQGFLRQQEAIIEVIYDDEESSRFLGQQSVQELHELIRFRLENGRVEIRLPSCFYLESFFNTSEEREQFLKEYFNKKEIDCVDDETLTKLASDQSCQFSYQLVSELPCESLNNNGAKIHFKISEDNMLCRACIFYGSRPVTEDEIFAVLKKIPIVEGIQRKSLQYVLESEFTGFFTLAKGRPAIPDKPGKIEKFFQEDERKIFSEMMEALTIDTRSIKDINIADRNQLLLRIGDIIPGKNGRFLNGKTIPKPKLGDSGFSITLGENAYTSDDGKEIYSKDGGHIIWKEKEKFINVEPVYVVDGNVDFSEGNIQGFVGKVIVKGDVKPKFKVIAHGDIEIQGSVEDAVIRSLKANVTVLGSVIHHKEGIVEAKETVHANIATNANLRGKNVVVEKECLNSYINAEENFESIGTPGVVLGGEIYAGKLIRANTIGSENGAHTKIHCGDVQPLRNKLRSVSQNVTSNKNRLNELKEIVKILNYKKKSNDLQGDQLDQLSKSLAEIPEIEIQLKEAFQEEKELQERIVECRPARLEVLNVLHPQVDIWLFEAQKTIQNSEKFTGFRCKNGLLHYYSL